MVDGFAFCFVSGRVILFVEGVDLVELGFFFCPVEGAIFVGSFKEHVFQIMCQSGMGGRVGFASCLHRHVCLDSRIFIRWTEDYRQPVLQGIEPCIGRVVGDIAVCIAAARSLFPFVILCKGVHRNYHCKKGRSHSF